MPLPLLSVSIHLVIVMLLLRDWFLVSETSKATKQSRLELAVFRRVRKLAKNAYSFFFIPVSDHLSACIGEALTGGMSENVDIGEFYRNQSRNSKFLQNRTKISGTSHVGQSTFYFVPG